MAESFPCSPPSTDRLNTLHSYFTDTYSFINLEENKTVLL